MDEHALPEEEFERYLDRLYDRELRKYEETWEEETLPEDCTKRTSADGR